MFSMSGEGSGSWQPSMMGRKVEVRLWACIRQLNQPRNSRNHDQSNAASKRESEMLPASTRQQSGAQRKDITNLPQHLQEQIRLLLGFKTNLVPELPKNPIIEKEKNPSEA